MNRTLTQLFIDSVNRFPENPLIREKQETYQSTSYRAAFEHVAEIAAGLMDLGFDSGDRVLLLSEGRNDWVFSELGILFAGGINVPVSVKIQDPPEIRFRCAHSSCRYIIVSERQFDKIMAIRKDLSKVERIIVMDDIRESGKDIMTLSELREKGRQFLKTQGDRFEARWKSVKEEDPANICYTSGTTADPKGIILTHRNYTANVEQAAAFYEIPEYYCSLLILPWDHSFAHTCGIYTLMSKGASMAAIQPGKTLMETTRNIGINIKEIRPHFLLSVPALSDSFKRNIERQIAAKGGAAKTLFRWGLKVGYVYRGDGFRDGRWQGCRLLAPLNSLFDTILFSKIREGFGNRLLFFVGGGALLDIEYQRFFAAVGMPVYQGYGLTEASPIISANHPGAQKMGTSGKIVPDLEIKICDENGQPLPAGKKGEIVVRGENVMKGYWNNPEATASTLKDGWLFTGDMGYLDQDGYLVVLGRFKSLLISDDGEKFSPEGIEESLLGQSPYIRQIMLTNNQKPYTTALIVMNQGALMEHLRSLKLSPADEEGQNAVIGLYIELIKRYQSDSDLKHLFPGKWMPSSFALLNEAFTEENRLMNSTMKLVRWRITRQYQDRIDTLYTPGGKNPYNKENRIIIGRMNEKP